ncbi:ScyD/ScyE family protein [Nocardioides iriomotensis]|uniref:ScyD/ScyE family protein n=1 Tax=Nocardioides iriomotensis TaxID=715784 RepID=A0A4Q5IUU1_9ACTN|nr:ScyD/ScyE family protein [Nocardioides iriomotensis]
MVRSKSPIQALLIAGAAIALPLAVVPAASVAETAQPRSSAPVSVASGLDNPRQITFKKGVGFLIAEAGVGGKGPCMPGPEGSPVCFGKSGAITRLRGGNLERLVKKLPSLADKDGAGAIGPSDVIPYGDHRIAFTVGLGADPAVREDLPKKGRWMAMLVAANLRGGHQDGELKEIADLGGFEARENPHPTAPDSNPVSVLKKKKKFLVTDAGGNDWLKVHRDRGVKVLAVFPDRSYAGSDEFQAVPTSVVKGPDGAYYISQLTGFPFVMNAAQIYRAVPGEAPTVYASGLTNVTDLGWHNGTLYAVQISDAGLASGGPPIGSLRQVVPGGTTHPAVAAGLFAPYGVAFKGSNAYVTTCAVCPNKGEVMSVPLG